MEVLLNFDLPTRAMSMVRVADVFFISNLPAFMVLAVLTFTASARQSAWMRATIYRISITNVDWTTMVLRGPGSKAPMRSKQ